MKIPKQLQNIDFRFFLVRENSKLPCEKRWTTENNYHFFSDKLLNHLKAGGNYGVLCGHGSLIALDFDNREFYDSIANQLPPTFTTLSAGKRLPHMYYLLSAEDTMFKKIVINDREGKVVCDIMADNSPIVGPGSKINRKYYNITNNRNIAEISLQELSEAFGDLFKPTKRREYTGPIGNNPKEVEKTVTVLLKLGILRFGNTLFKCFKHDMNGKGNLSVMENGRIWCFHCQTLWRTIEEFVIEFEKFKHLKGEQWKYHSQSKEICINV